MRDWLSHLLLSELYERRQRGTISIEGCQEVREAVKTGALPAGVEYLVADAPTEEGSGAAWFEQELRRALHGWEADGEVSAERAAQIRAHLDAEEWADAARALIAE